MNSFSGMEITVSNEAYEMVPIFPDKPRTKRRMRRTRAKFGSIERMEPLALKKPFGLIVHPIIYAQLKKRSKRFEQ